MFKKCLSLMLAICLLLTASSVAFMEETDRIEALAELEAAAELLEVPVEDAEADLVEGGSLIEEAIAGEAPVEELPEVPEEADGQSADAEVAGQEAEATPEIAEAVAEEAAAEAEPAAEDAVEPQAEAEQETAAQEPATEQEPAVAQEAAAEAPAPVVVEEAADASAKLATAEASAEAGVQEIVLTKNAKFTATMGDYWQINLNGLAAKSFKSSKKKVATVSADGVIACVGGGKTKITATISKKKKIVLTLTVVDPTKPTAVYMSLDGASVPGTITAAKGVPFTLVAAAAPEGTAVTNFKWTSSKKKIATVSGGVVTPKKVGTTKITVKTTRGGKKRSVKVKVIDPYKATAVYLNKTGRVYMTAKSTMQLTAAMLPENATSTLKWSSSNKKVATVNKYGLVTAKKKGTCTITVKTSSGKKAKVKIKVFALAGAAKTLTGEWSGLADDNTLNPGDVYTYVVSTTPLNANANVVWTSGNNEVIQVLNYYRADDLTFQAEVLAYDLGYTTLTATDTVTGLSQTATLIVKPASAPTSITFPTLTNNTFVMQAGTKADVLYQVNPQDSLSHDANRAYVEYNSAICDIEYDHNNADRNCRSTMDYNLHITAKAAGTTEVKVTLKNNVTASFTLVVE